MVQLANPARLVLSIELGTQKSVRNSVGVQVPEFISIATVHAGAWSRSLVQSYAVAGTDRENTDIYVIRHRKSYEGITRVKIGDDVHQLIDIQSEPVPGPNAYDLLTVKREAVNG